MEQKMKLRRRMIQISMYYLCWQAVFPVIILSTGWLTPQQMGYTFKTVHLGILVGVIILTTMYILAKWMPQLVLRLYGPGITYIKTREQFEQFWEATLGGCDDGILAETHWSGTVLPLLMLVFETVGILYPFNVIPAIIVRWVLHVFAHTLIPRGGEKERVFGGLKFIAPGLLLSDIKNSIAFIISGNIIAPGYVTSSRRLHCNVGRKQRKNTKISQH